MKPSVGRIIHYHNPKNHNGAPYAAIITAVEESAITVAVFTPEGGRFALDMSVSPGAEGSDMPEYWEWPPRVE